MKETILVLETLIIIGIGFLCLFGHNPLEDRGDNISK